MHSTRRRVVLSSTVSGVPASSLGCVSKNERFLERCDRLWSRVFPSGLWRKSLSRLRTLRLRTLIEAPRVESRRRGQAGGPNRVACSPTDGCGRSDNPHLTRWSLPPDRFPEAPLANLREESRVEVCLLDASASVSDVSARLLPLYPYPVATGSRVRGLALVRARTPRMRRLDRTQLLGACRTR